jgi:hypothetical protein
LEEKPILLAGIAISIICTYVLCNLSVQQKWQIRNELAVTEAEREYAQTDGANIVFTAYFTGPFEAVLYTAFWGWVGWKVWPKIKQKRKLKLFAGINAKKL